MNLKVLWNMKKIILGLSVLVVVYICTPYYSTWQIFQAIKTGSAEKMRDYIDFPKVKSSLKQQINVAVEEQVEEDPMAGAMLKMFMPMMEIAVDEYIKPERIAEFIKNGKLQPRKSSKLKAKEKPVKTDLSWFAFFDTPTRFRISMNDLTLYMDLQDWHWQITSVGIHNLMKQAENKKPKEFIVDEIDNNSPPIPVAVHDIESVREDVAGSFQISGEYNNEVRVEGDFTYLPSRDAYNPTVTWSDVIDSDGKSVFGEFSAEKLAKRERFNMGDQYYLGKWTGTIPKLDSSNKAVSASGVCNFEVPTLIQSYSLGKKDLKKLQTQSQSAVSLSTLENGKVSLSYYAHVELDNLQPTIIIRNASGEPLKQSASFSRTSEDPIVDVRFNQPMWARTTSITVSGTPDKVELYFPLSPVKIEVPFIAETPPVIIAGKPDKPIKHARLVQTKPELPLKAMDIETLKKSISVSFHERVNYDKTKVRYLQLLFPKIANSTFSSLDYSDLNALLNGKIIEAQPSKSHSREYRNSVEFVKSNQDFTYVNYDELRGTISIKYPAAIETFILKQGETSHGATLNGLTVILPVNADIPYYSHVFNTRSIVALDGKGRQISYLGADSWNRESNKTFFWGEPSSVQIKRVTSWIELKIPVNVNASDLIID